MLVRSTHETRLDTTDCARIGRDIVTASKDGFGRLSRRGSVPRRTRLLPVPNERLRSAILEAGLTLTEFAGKVQVDPKTVERWIGLGRTPHRSSRWATASLLGADEAYLWPEVADDVRTRSASTAEIVHVYPHRGAVPHDLWPALLDSANDQIGLLAYAGLFLSDTTPDLPPILAAKAAAGTTVRLLLGDPKSAAVATRGDEEGIGEGLAARIRLSASYLSAGLEAPGVQLRYHETTLYNSIYRFDDQLLINMHVYGAAAVQSPVMHLRRIPGGRLFAHYMESFEKVWHGSTSCHLTLRRPDDGST